MGVICCTCIYIQCDPTSWNYPCFNLLLFWCFLCGRCVSKCLHHQLLIVSSTAVILPSHINCKSRVPTSKGLEKPTYTSIYLFMRYIISIYCIYSHNSSQGPSNQHLYIHTHVQTSISPTQIWTVPETCLKQAHKFLWHRQCRECTGRRNLSCKPVKGVLTLQSGGLLYIPLLAISVYTCGFCDLLQVCFSEGWTLLRGNACNAVPRTLQLAFTFNLKKAEVRPRTCKLAHLQRARVEGLVYRNDVNPVYIWRACHPD